jgi:hypothetical protein
MTGDGWGRPGWATPQRSTAIYGPDFDLHKLDVAGSIPVARSNAFAGTRRGLGDFGGLLAVPPQSDMVTAAGDYSFSRNTVRGAFLSVRKVLMRYGNRRQCSNSAGQGDPRVESGAVPLRWRCFSSAMPHEARRISSSSSCSPEWPTTVPGAISWPPGTCASHDSCRSRSRAVTSRSSRVSRSPRMRRARPLPAMRRWNAFSRRRRASRSTRRRRSSRTCGSASSPFSSNVSRATGFSRFRRSRQSSV